jgi:RecA-family ATPase
VDCSSSRSAKTGKTTAELNLAWSLITGADFLDRFPVRPITGRVAFLNYEVSAAQLARWGHDVGVLGDRMLLVNLRGRRNPFGNDEDRERLAEQLRAHEVESLIVDPFGRAFVGKSQNDAGEVGAWLADLDRWARADVGAVDVILSAHAGWTANAAAGQRPSRTGPIPLSTSPATTRTCATSERSAETSKSSRTGSASTATAAP